MPGIFLRASGTDSNTGASQFVGFPVPLGLVNGDVAIVAIAVPVGVTVSPPDASWTQIAQSDPTQFGIVAFWTTVLSPPTSWVFALSSSTTTCGALAVYANTDTFNPFDATTVTVSAQAGSLGAITASLNGDELVAFFAAATAGTFTPTGGYTEYNSKSFSAHATISFQRQSLQNAGAQSAVTETFSQTAAGASIAIALAPSASTVSYDDSYRRVFEAMPEGIDNLLDFTSGVGDFYKFFWVIGSAIKLGFDLLDLARQELVPYLARYKLPDWERAFGLVGSLITQTGTVPQRQAQVLGAWRSAAAQDTSISLVQSILGPLLGYNPTNLPLVLENDRGALTLSHSFDLTAGVDVSIPVGTTTLTAFVNGSDGGIVAKMGAQLALPFSVADTSLFSFVLTAPNGTQKTWSAGATSGPLWLTAPSFAGAQVQGLWTLAITNASGGTVTLYTGASLFVEGTQRGQSTAGAAFEWGIYADPAHLAENGTRANFSGARAALQKLKLSHCIASLIQSLNPYPDTSTGVHAAIPDECIPV